MPRTLASAALVAGAIAFAAAADAQRSPGDLGLGTKLGMAQRSNSGQVGTVTLFRHGANRTLVVVRLAGEPGGRSEPAHVHRGHSCDTLDPNPMYSLAPVVDGVSSTIVPVAQTRLLSGNYVVNVHSASDEQHDVSCGELYH